MMKQPGSRSMAERLIPMPVDFTIKDMMRFWSFTDRSAGSDACWPWTGTIRRHTDRWGCSVPSYGRFKFGQITYSAHRVAYYLEYRVDPGVLLVCHECNNTLCVNVQHLYIGTQSQNMLQCFDDSRKSHRGQSHPRTDLLDADIPVIREAIQSQTCQNVANNYGVSLYVIQDISSGRRWSHVK